MRFFCVISVFFSNFAFENEQKTYKIDMKRLITVLLTFLALSASSARERINFDKGWRFTLGDNMNMAEVEYNDSQWRLLDLPHDWAIEGSFSADNPSGAGGGALPGGVGWYRKHFRVKDVCKYFLEFDGVYMNSIVFVNGEMVNFRPYGYSSFVIDITRYLRCSDNVIAVRVDNSDQPNSRWYSGCGIYRHVWLTKTEYVHVKQWGLYVETDAKSGLVKVKTEVAGKGYTVQYSMTDAAGREVAKGTGIPANSNKTVLHLNPASVKLWSPAKPYIYKVRARVLIKGKVVDEVTTTTAFRDFRFDAKTGFWLNGKNMKLNGVCEHHDFGCLGAAVREDALHRKLKKLKAMGVNAIRSSHNPPAPELLNMCDTMGFIVMDESFDMWRRRKTQNDYARFFDKWHERDLVDMVLRDRNHPCILMWSIGNEVLEQWSSADADTLTLEQANLILNAGHDASTLAKDGEKSVNTMLAEHLADIIRRLDTSRPITAGCNEPSPNNHLFKGNALDIIGFNYHHQWIKDVPQNFPGRPFIMTESVSALQTNGYYRMPSDSVYIAPRDWRETYKDSTYMCSAYDNMHAPWSSTHEETWDVVKHTPYVGGQFIWTGFDYLGEPTPYGFPARSSYFGIIDLAGQPKDVYYMYESEWTNKPVLYLFPHWNWQEGQEIDMWCYYSQADEVELFINGKSQGVRRKTARTGQPIDGSALNTPYHVGWRVKFEPGEVMVIARKGGKTTLYQKIHTAGAPHHIRLDIDYKGKELTFVQATVVDKNGNRCPLADNQLRFKATGGSVIATDNGCQTSMERFTSPWRKAFFGRCIAVVKGKGELTVSADGLVSNKIRF